MANQKEKQGEQTEKLASQNGRRSMTPEEAEKRGLDPSAYGKAVEE
ncbi:hypothetical protein [Pseudophaeobacter sp.]